MGVEFSPETLLAAQDIRIAFFDIDGVLTDGRLWFGPGGETHKAFHVHDGLGIKLALAAGIQPGDVILRVNNSDIKDVKGYTDVVAKLDSKKPVALLIRDENGTRFVTLRAEE